MTWNADGIRNFLTYITEDPSPNAARSFELTANKSNRYIVYRMLQAMNARQTATEREAETTVESNGQGFNASDARVLSNIANRSIQFKNLTSKQARLVATKLRKYAGQLADVASSRVTA